MKTHYDMSTTSGTDDVPKSFKQMFQHSKTFKHIQMILDIGKPITKYEAAAKCGVDHRTAQRILTHLHLEEEIYIYEWVRVKAHRVHIPRYRKGNKKDAPRPASMMEDEAAYRKAYRSNPDVREETNKKQRNQRALRNAKQTKAELLKLGDWQFALKELGAEI